MINPSSDPAWLSLLDRSRASTPFHHPAWLGLIARHFGFEITAAVVGDDPAHLDAGLPLAVVASRLTGHRIVALPFTDMCPPLVAAEAAPEARERLAAAVEEQRARLGIPLLVHERFEELPGGQVQPAYLSHEIDLTQGPDAAEARYASRTRRNTRKAIRLGLTYERRTDPDALDAFFALHVATRRRLGVPTQPRRFIRGLAGLFAEGLGFVGLVQRDGRPIAAAVFLGYGGCLVYKYGASDAAHLDARPNNLLFTEAIRGACAEGYTRLHLGRTDVGQDGLIAFKRGWGAEERPLAYTAVGGEPGAGRAAAILAPVIRRSPPWVSRAIGELFYRHAA